MGYVSSYFRRSAGAASSGNVVQGRVPTVAIYKTATGTSLLRDRGRGEVLGLQFGTGLPGGFLDASFTLRTPAPKVWPVDTGQKVIVSLGGRTVWQGWVEDVRRRQRGRTEELGVTCLGPFQLVQQRKIPTFGYTGFADGGAAILYELNQHCDLISTDYSQIQQTGVSLGGINKSYWPIADLIKLVCDGGNSAGLSMLFALWESTKHPLSQRAGNITPDPKLEEATVGQVSSTYWELTETFADHSAMQFSDAMGNGPCEAEFVHTDTASAQCYITTKTPHCACVASTVYIAEYSIYWANIGTSDSLMTLVWYNSGGGGISTMYLTTRPAVEGWTTYREEITAPAGAAYVKIEIEVGIVNPGGLGTAYVDNIYLFRKNTDAVYPDLPQAFLWPRDLSGYDYLIHTARLENGLDVTESTRDLTNAVLASYGATPSFTAYAEDAISQAAYRRRDHLVEAGSDVNATLAASMRDTYLAVNKDPRDEPGTFTVQDRGAITTKHGAPVDLPLIRAGHRLLIADGEYAGRVFMIAQTRWSADGLQITPERELSTAEILARV